MEKMARAIKLDIFSCHFSNFEPYSLCKEKKAQCPFYFLAKKKKPTKKNQQQPKTTSLLH